MNFKTASKACKIKLKRFICGRRRSMVKSYISIFLVFALGISLTAAWFTSKNSVKLLTDDYSFDSAVSMRTNQGLQLTTNIQLKNFKLDEATSVDGRNLFLPTEGNFTTTTANMIFREANAGDRNVRFVYKDFTLSSDSETTDVYIKGYKIQIGNEIYQDEIKITYNNGRPIAQYFPPDCPLRMAFIDDSGSTPKFIDPGARVRSFAKKTNAVDTINAVGEPTTAETDPDSFSSFYYMVGDPLFKMRNHEQKKCTLVVWLEGTIGDCDKYIGKTISVEVEIESNYDNYDTITFVDDTLGDDGSDDYQSGKARWVGNGKNGPPCLVAMSYRDTDDGFGNRPYKTVIMKKKTTAADKPPEWEAKLPSAVETDISFYRLSTENITDLGYGVIYNAWHTMVGINNDNMLSPKIRNESWRVTQVNSPQLYNTSTEAWYFDSDNKWKLQESRRVKNPDNEEIKSVVYTARRGNGFGDLDNSSNDFQDFNGTTVNAGSLNNTQKMQYWLSPCVGYWEYNTGGSGGGGGGSDTTKYTVNISLNTGKHPYIERDTNPDNQIAKMQIRFGSDSSTYTYVDIPRTSSNRFELNKYTLDKGTVLSGFRLQYTNSSSYEDFENVTYTFNNSNNPTFTMNDNKSFNIA